jgi:hypothetical protein
MDLESIERELIEFDRLNAIAREKKASNDKIENLFRRKLIKMEDLKGVEDATLENSRQESLDTVMEIQKSLSQSLIAEPKMSISELRHRLWVADQLSDWQTFSELLFDNKEYRFDEIIKMIAYSKVAGDCLTERDFFEPNPYMAFPLAGLQVRTVSGFNRCMFEEYRFDPTPKSKQTVSVKNRKHIESILIREAEGMDFWNIFLYHCSEDFNKELVCSAIYDQLYEIFRVHKIASEGTLKVLSEKERLLFFREVIRNLTNKIEILDEMTIKQQLEQMLSDYQYIITSKVGQLSVKRSNLIENCKKLDLKLQLCAVKEIRELNKKMLFGNSVIKQLGDHMNELEKHLKYYLQELNPTDEVARIMAKYKESFDRIVGSFVT